jgi:hypothetical protein
MPYSPNVVEEEVFSEGQINPLDHPPLTPADTPDLHDLTSKTRRPALPHLTIRLEAFYHHLPLGLVLPEIPEDLFLIWVVLTLGALSALLMLFAQ